jgi:tripartite-type tricarboxylate transporter receptor subunit TctC
VNRTVLAFVIACFSSLCFSQNYPAKPIRIIVPFPVGGIADLYARLVGTRMQEA